MGNFLGIPLLAEIEMWTLVNCSPFQDGFVARLLVLTRYCVPIITLFIFAIGIQRQEIYLFFFGIATVISLLLNWIVRFVVADSTHVIATCTDAYGDTMRWPSWQSQHASFVVAFVVTYPVLYGAGMPVYYALFLILFYFAVIAADIMLNYHTQSQVVSAVLLGVSSAFVCQLIIRVMVPYFPWILAVPQVNALGYVDTMCAWGTGSIDPHTDTPLGRQPLETQLYSVLLGSGALSDATAGSKFNFDMNALDGDDAHSGAEKES